MEHLSGAAPPLVVRGTINQITSMPYMETTPDYATRTVAKKLYDGGRWINEEDDET